MRRITAHLHHSKNNGQEYSLQDRVLFTVTPIYSILLSQKDARWCNPFNSVNTEGAFVDQIYQNAQSINWPCLLEKREFVWNVYVQPSSNCVYGNAPLQIPHQIQISCVKLGAYAGPPWSSSKIYTRVK